MPIEFATTKLSKRVYSRLIRRIVWELYRYDTSKMREFMKHWDIKVIDSLSADTRFFEHVNTTDGQKINPGIPSGVTGDHVMFLYVNDEKGELYIRQNGKVIAHELCHAVLLCKEGTKSGGWVKWVHDADSRKDFFTIKFWYMWPLWFKTYITVIDVRDLLD